jgi:hypothetical protein
MWDLFCDFGAWILNFSGTWCLVVGAFLEGFDLNPTRP